MVGKWRNSTIPDDRNNSKRWTEQVATVAQNAVGDDVGLGSVMASTTIIEASKVVVSTEASSTSTAVTSVEGTSKATVYIRDEEDQVKKGKKKCPFSFL